VAIEERARPRRRRRPEPGHRSQFEGVIEKLDGLTPLQQEFLRAHWLSQVRYLGDKAEFSKRWHFALRLTAIVGGVTIPALIGLNVSGKVSLGVRWSAFGLGLLVALATAVDEFFHLGEQWRHYRRTAELLKSVRTERPAAQRPVWGMIASAGITPSRPARKSAMACMISASVFITNGP
jgi:Protein of unknown function (DUF4231)